MWHRRIVLVLSAVHSFSACLCHFQSCHVRPCHTCPVVTLVHSTFPVTWFAHAQLLMPQMFPINSPTFKSVHFHLLSTRLSIVLFPFLYPTYLFLDFALPAHCPCLFSLSPFPFAHFACCNLWIEMNCLNFYTVSLSISESNADLFMYHFNMITDCLSVNPLLTGLFPLLFSHCFDFMDN